LWKETGTVGALPETQEGKMTKENIKHIIAILPVLLLTLPESSWALQSHGAPEGNYVHQMAHLLFLGSLIYLYWHTRRTPDLKGRGWKYLQTFCIVFACWNIVAFVGHEVFDQLSPQDFINKNSLDEHLVGPLTFSKLIYFATKMDHLLYVPALFALVVSLRTFYLDALKEGGK